MKRAARLARLALRSLTLTGMAAVSEVPFSLTRRLLRDQDGVARGWEAPLAPCDAAPMLPADWLAAEPEISAAERARDERRWAPELDGLRCPNSGWDGACYPGQCPTHNP
jgi:hypothetical protein